tara:strand:+ start:689 stop:931 length:243 start_codon:yes stop_codon:yes gene_type:complete
MEIILELENSNLVIEFEPDFMRQNFADHNQVQWQLPNEPNTRRLDDVFSLVSEEQSNVGAGDCLECLRLLCRHHSGGVDP